MFSEENEGMKYSVCAFFNIHLTETHLLNLIKVLDYISQT